MRSRAARFPLSSSQSGFSLAELLVSLLILAEIATFTIPKIFGGSFVMEKRLAIAKETMSTLAAINQQYLLENGGCYPNVTCKTDASGNPTDGLPAQSWGADPGMANLSSYLDTHLNYTRKLTYYDSNYYELGNGTVVTDYFIHVTETEPGRATVAWTPLVFIDTNLDEVMSGEACTVGVNGKQFMPTFSITGATIPSENIRRERTGLGYNLFESSIFEWKEHPEDTCEAILPLFVG